MENSKGLVLEIVQGEINKRNVIGTYEDYKELEKKNSFKNEMYRSYYLFDDTFKKYVERNKSVNNYQGSALTQFADEFKISISPVCEHRESYRSWYFIKEEI